jgi:3',5'-nucleoside bisphosphate phosphatase
MKPDLHCHSHFSDGKHSPQFLIERALANAVSHLAITDHDCVAACANLPVVDGLVLIQGVEISCSWLEKEIHIVGLGIDSLQPELGSLLQRQQQARRERIQAMHEQLDKLGTGGLLDYMENLPCHAYTRSHVADFLVAQGLCKSRQKAFKSYLGKRGKIFVDSQWCSLPQAIAAIVAAGGIAVLAHPGRYPLGKTKLQQLIQDFAAAGGEALEASYGNIDPIMKNQLTGLAQQCDLYLSLGSDFHDAAAHWTDVGRVPAFNATDEKNAIWHHPRWHFGLS